MIVWIVIAIIVAVSAFLFYASYSIQSSIYLKALNHNPKAGKAVALTFDDGPDPVQTPKVLDILKKHNIKACFFCIGSKIAGNEHIICRMVDEGHLIGNHSYSHAGKFPLYSLTKMMNDVLECNAKIEEVTGDETKLFRPPFGVTNPIIARMVKKMGFITIGWNIRSFDTSTKNQEKILKRIERKLSSGAVILLHDRLIFSDNLLIRVIDIIKQSGYTTLGVDELFRLKI